MPETCEVCSAWAARTQTQLDNRVRNMAAAPDVAPCPCPRCGLTAWVKTEAFIEQVEPRMGHWQQIKLAWAALCARRGGRYVGGKASRDPGARNPGAPRDPRAGKAERR